MLSRRRLRPESGAAPGQADDKEKGASPVEGTPLHCEIAKMQNRGFG